MFLNGFKLLEMMVIVLGLWILILGSLDFQKWCFEAFSGFFGGKPRLCSSNAAALMPRNGPETLLYVFLCTMPRHGISLQRHAAALNKGFYTDCVFGTF